jgi:DNA-binding ferritin-like protein
MACQMIREVIAGQEAVLKTARSVFPLQVYEKTAWMLRSLLA